MINIYKLFKNQRGLSLVELLIALSILVLVLGLAFSFFFFSTKSFQAGSNQSNVQQNLRIASDFIHKEARHAIELQLLDSSFVPTEGYEYIFVEDSSIKHGKFANGNFVKVNKSDHIIDSAGLEFTVKKLDNGSNILEFVIKAKDKKQDYSIDSIVYLNNIVGRNPSTGSVLRYKKPE